MSAQEIWLELDNVGERVFTFTPAIRHRSLYIIGYAIKGIPTTGGIPDSPHYKFYFEANDNTAFHRGGTIIGKNYDSATQYTAGHDHQIPIFLDSGSYTHHHYPHPGRVIHEDGDLSFLQKLKVKVQDENGSTPSPFNLYTQCQILLRVES